MSSISFSIILNQLQYLLIVWSTTVVFRHGGTHCRQSTSIDTSPVNIDDEIHSTNLAIHRDLFINPIIWNNEQLFPSAVEKER